MDAQPGAPASVSALSPNPPAGLIEYTHWIYALYAFSVVTGLVTTRLVAMRFVFGLPSIVALIMNYLRRSESRGTWLETHFRWQIRTFWYALLWLVVTSIVAVPLLLLSVINFLLGLFGFALIGLWVIYRVVRGWLALRDTRPMPLAMQ